jgi:hypothetical protein
LAVEDEGLEEKVGALAADEITRLQGEAQRLLRVEFQ